MGKFSKLNERSAYAYSELKRTYSRSFLLKQLTKMQKIQFKKNQYLKELILKRQKILKEYDLIKEYERFFSMKINKYEGKSASMKEKELDYLNEYTRLLDT